MKWVWPSPPRRDSRGRFAAKAPPSRLSLVTYRTWVFALLILSPCAAALAFLTDLWSLQANVCEVASARSVCSALGLVEQTSPQAKAALSRAQATGSCDAYREYLRTAPKGNRADRVARILAAAKTETLDVWREEERRLPLYVVYSANTPARRDKADFAADAERLCVPYRSGLFQFRSVQTEINKRDCGIGQHCVAEGFAVCLIRVRYQTVRELCPDR